MQCFSALTYGHLEKFRYAGVGFFFFLFPSKWQISLQLRQPAVLSEDKRFVFVCKLFVCLSAQQDLLVISGLNYITQKTGYIQGCLARGELCCNKSLSSFVIFIIIPSEQRCLCIIPSPSCHLPLTQPCASATSAVLVLKTGRVALTAACLKRSWNWADEIEEISESIRLRSHIKPWIRFV